MRLAAHDDEGRDLVKNTIRIIFTDNGPTIYHDYYKNTNPL